MPAADSTTPKRATKQSDSNKKFTRWDAIVAEANRLNAAPTTYSQSARTGPSSYDCSSSCSKLLQTAGYNVPFCTTVTIRQYLKPGKDPSGRLTFWDKPFGAQAHIFAEMTIKGKTSMWGTNTQNPGHAVSWHSHTTSGFTPYHIDGLDEPADEPNNPDLSAPGGGGHGTQDESAGEGTNQFATAFASFLNLPSVFDQAESQALTGQRSFINDQPLFPFVEQICQASLRNFQSMPNGNFFAFFSDYFGGFSHRTPYWEISDMEIIDGGINLSDEALATHVATIGDTVNFDGVNQFDRIQTGGVVTLFNAFQADFLNGLPPEPKTKPKTGNDADSLIASAADNLEDDFPSLANKRKAIAFLQKYGVRPYVEPAPMVRSPYYEMFLAYQKFCLMWSRQFLTTFEFTFMPELFPGGLVAFPDHGIQCYIDEVVHECDYEQGFVTRANLSAPSAMRDAKTGRPTGNRPYIHSGMIRAALVDTDPTKPKNKHKSEKKAN